jgi:hypothetical protein
MKILKSTWEDGKSVLFRSGKREDENAIQEQANLNVCRSCDGLYDDEELEQIKGEK